MSAVKSMERVKIIEPPCLFSPERRPEPWFLGWFSGGGMAKKGPIVSELTRILQSVEQGDASADQLLPLVYDELRKLAAARMTNEAAGHTLQPTALVHEAWLRLTHDEPNTPFVNRAHFFAAAAEAMRRI